jgi:NADP-dependent aldehyde dehydrogenase
LYQAPVSLLLAQDPLLQHEVFGPLAVLVEVADEAEMQAVLRAMQGQLTATVHAESDDGPLARLLPALSEKAGRVLFNGYPTGVEVCDAMVHGGPWPATTDSRGTSVGKKPSNVFCVRCACKTCLPHCCRLLSRMLTL